MSSDDYFDDPKQLDSAVFAELDAIEAAHSSATQFRPHPHANSPPSSPATTRSKSTFPLCSTILSTSKLATPFHLPATKVPSSLKDFEVDAEDSYDAFFDNIDPTELERLDRDVEDAYKNIPNMPGSSFAAGSGPIRQLNLFGDPLSPRSPHARQLQPRISRVPHKLFGQKSRKIKRWDHTAFAKSGWKFGKSTKGKGKEKAIASDGEANAEVHLTEEFEQFPDPVPKKYSFSVPPPFKHIADPLAAQTWVYPTNKPKRDYQFNIVRDSLFENSLVSLPTGLGKTFIAGVVMLNYYRWFPEGKVVFVAPTKPLVAQQIEACHQACGIPGGDAAELTGQIPGMTRAKAWVEKRVFFMTPQTFMNDLISEICDPTDIILLVIDEAHKATGNYAYAQIVRYLMAKNAHFRVLALTATPGSKPEAVQAIVDSLHISNIEIRDENSIDLRQYILPKKISTHIVKMTADIIKVRDMLAKVMEKFTKRMVDSGLIYNLNVVTLHSYRCNALMQQFNQNGMGKKFPWVYGNLRKLGLLARAMGYLLECSISMCHDEVQGLSTEVEKDGKQLANLRSEPLFQDVVKELERQHNAGFSLHPKLDKLQGLTLDYFAQAKADVDEAAARDRLDLTTEPNFSSKETKMMIFTNFRSSVDEIVDLLNTHRPMVRATRFIGQGSDKHGRKGIAQKDQLEVIKKFREGIYNVLVATSIGEEGLDIGEVDMIICYDAQKTPIRMLQRVGRTGRKRAGRVEVLLSEAREEANWERAKGDYESVQSSIIRGETLELFADVERLLPDHIKPKCLESLMVIEEYVRDSKPHKKTISKGIKRKRDTDVTRNIPEGATNGFIPSSKLIPKRNSKMRRVAPREYNPEEVEDDDDDRAILAGIHGLPLTKPLTRGQAKEKEKTKSKIAKRAVVSNARSKKSTPPAEITLSQLDRQVEDDTDDMEIERGFSFPSPEHSLVDAHPSKKQPQPNISRSPVSIQSPLDHSLIVADTNKNVLSLDHLPRQLHSMEDHSWLLESDDEVDLMGATNYSLPGPAPSTVQSRLRRPPLSRSHSENQSVILPPVPRHASMSPDTPFESTFPIRVPVIRRKRTRFFSTTSDSRSGQVLSPIPSPSQPRVHSKQRRRHIDSRATRELLDLEVQVSGDETTSGSSGCDEEESESDLRFVEELAATQASSSYDQTSAYRNSLFTQVPGRSDGPQFVTKPVRRGAFSFGRQRFNLHASSSPLKDQVTDQYSMDSFVVEDDDDVLIQDDSSSDL